MAAIYELQKTDQIQQPSEVAIGLLNLSGFELAQRIAKVFAESDLVPTQYRKNVANCVIALNMASRMGADPLMVMQNLYLVNGRPAWSSQFLIATFNQCGRFSAMRFEFQGEPGTDNHGCRAFATENKTGQRLTGAWITIGMAKKEGWYGKSGSKWQTMPEQMLMYRAAAFFVRTHAPEISMGLLTRDEIADNVVDMESSQQGVYAMPQDQSTDDVETSNNIQDDFNDKCASSLPDIELDCIEQFLQKSSAKTQKDVATVMAQALENWDRFANAVRKFATKCNTDVRSCPEYLRLMEMQKEFPEAYEAAIENTGLKPDSIENCQALIKAVNEAIDMINAK